MTLYLFFTVLIVLILRLTIIRLHKHHFSDSLIETGDSAGHMIFIRQLKKDIKSKYITSYLIKDDAKISYPFLFHRIASIFPTHIIEKRFLINLFLLIINLILVNLICFYFFGEFKKINFVVFNLLFVLSISNNFFFSNNISYLDIGERYLSRSLVSFYYLFVFYFLNSFDFIEGSLIAIFAALSLSASKFARQAVIFPTLIICVFHYQLFIPFLAGFLLLLIFDYKKFLYSIRYQIIHLFYYKKSISKSFMAKNALSRFINFGDLKNLFLNLSRDKIGTIIFKEPIRSIIFLPEIFVLISIIYFGSDQFNDLSELKIILAVLLVYLLTSTNFLNFLGESYRYIEYSIYFLGPFLISNYLLELEFLTGVYLYILYNLIIILFYYIYLNRPKDNNFKQDLKDMILSIDFTSRSNVLTIPLRTIHGIILNSEANGLWWQPESINRFVIKKIIEQYPFPNKNLNFLINRYKINIIVLERKYEDRLPWKYDFSNYKQIYQNDTFKVYET